MRNLQLVFLACDEHARSQPGTMATSAVGNRVPMTSATVAGDGTNKELEGVKGTDALGANICAGLAGGTTASAGLGKGSEGNADCIGGEVTDIVSTGLVVAGRGGGVTGGDIGGGDGTGAFGNTSSSFVDGGLFGQPICTCMQQ